MYYRYHGNQIRCHGNRSHAWLFFADLCRSIDICSFKGVFDILLCFLRSVAMETKCHAWLIFPDFYELRAFLQIWGHLWYNQLFKVVIGVARGTLRVTWLLLAIARILVSFFVIPFAMKILFFVLFIENTEWNLKKMVSCHSYDVWQLFYCVIYPF